LHDGGPRVVAVVGVAAEVGVALHALVGPREEAEAACRGLEALGVALVLRRFRRLDLRGLGREPALRRSLRLAATLVDDRLRLRAFLRRLAALQDQLLQRLDLRLAADAEVNQVADDRVLFLRLQQQERRHRRAFDAVGEDAAQVLAARFALAFRLARRGVLERPGAEVARVRVDPQPGRPAAVAGEAVTVQAVAAIELAAGLQRLT